MHWTKRRKLRKDWAWEIRSIVGQRSIQAKKKLVTIQQYRSRLFDQDNLTASVIPLVNALKDCSLIYDDSPEWLDLHVTQQVGKPVRTEITIEDLEKSNVNGV